MKRMKWITIMVTFVLTMLTIKYTPIHHYVDAAKQSERVEEDGLAVAVFAQAPVESTNHGTEEEDADLFEQIKREAEKRRVEPINAKVDRIWKAIPGYNGLEVDIEKSYRLSKYRKPDEPLRLVMREIPPSVHLDDLGAYPIYKGNSQKPMVSFMINVAWGEEYLPKMLQILEKEDIKATFFFDGKWLSKNIEIAKGIQEKGHEMSNHAYSHKNMSELNANDATQEIVKTQQLLEEKLGVNNTLFAPPSGDFDQETVNIAHRLKLRTILWSLDTVDWRKPTPESVVRKIATHVEPGSLILMHPTYSSSEALEGMIKEIKKKGLVFGTVSQLLSPERVQPIESPHFF